MVNLKEYLKSNIPSDDTVKTLKFDYELYEKTLKIEIILESSCCSLKIDGQDIAICESIDKVADEFDAYINGIKSIRADLVKADMPSDLILKDNQIDHTGRIECTFESMKFGYEINARQNAAYATLTDIEKNRLLIKLF